MSGFRYERSSFIVVMFLILFIALNADNVDINNNEGETYLAFAETMPAPEGGLEAIYKNIKYPRLAQEAGIEGKVYLLAFIDENGSVKDVKVVKGIGGGCDEAAIEAVKKISFSPGINKGQPVKVKLSLSVVFKLK
ncbi:MAG: energy transducer TonB [Ignavibacteria bacterium]